MSLLIVLALQRFAWHAGANTRDRTDPRQNSLVYLIQHDEELDVYIDWQASSEDLSVFTV